MALEFTQKQSYEEYFIAADFVDVITTTGETLTLGSCTVEAIDKAGNDVASVVLDQATKKLETSPDSSSGFTDNMLAIRCRAGTATNSPYKITFKGVTSELNKWEVDINLKIKEL